MNHTKLQVYNAISKQMTNGIFEIMVGVSLNAWSPESRVSSYAKLKLKTRWDARIDYTTLTL
jgi:hypothetical protein